MPRSFTLPPPVHPEHVVTYLPVFYQTDDTHRNRYTLLQRSTSRSATTPMSCSCRGSKFYVPDYHGNPLPDVPAITAQGKPISDDRAEGHIVLPPYSLTIRTAACAAERSRVARPRAQRAAPGDYGTRLGKACAAVRHHTGSAQRVVHRKREVRRRSCPGDMVRIVLAAPAQRSRTAKCSSLHIAPGECCMRSGPVPTKARSTPIHSGMRGSCTS